MMIITKFDIGQHVIIMDPKYSGRVTEIRQDGLNLFYKVQYWCEGKCNFMDLCENELAPEPVTMHRCGI